MAFSVDLPALVDLMGQMERFDQKVASVCENTNESVTALHVSWEGEAAGQHLQAHDLWEQGTQQMTAALRQLRSDVAAAHRNYDRAFEAGRAMWDGM
ncbi:WXG100 family type VII secretion target [Mycobacterium sp. NPDC049093]